MKMEAAAKPSVPAVSSQSVDLVALEARFNELCEAPPCAEVVKSLKNGIVVNLLGMGAAILGMQFTVGLLVAKVLTSSANAYYQGITPGSSIVLALDVFLVQSYLGRKSLFTQLQRMGALSTLCSNFSLDKRLPMYGEIKLGFITFIIYLRGLPKCIKPSCDHILESTRKTLIEAYSK